MPSPSMPDRPPRLAVYAGVFDPPTMAHIEIVETALLIFDEIVVVVAHNPNKPSALFSPEERVRLFEESLSETVRPRVRVTDYSGLTAPYAVSLGACALVRGMLREAELRARGALARPGDLDVRRSDFLRVLDPEKTFTLELKDSDSAAVCTTDDGYGYVIMPLARDR